MRRLPVVLMSWFVAALLFLNAETVKIPDYKSVPHIGSYATQAEFDAALNDTRFRLTRVGYPSDGFTFLAYVSAPAEPPKRKLPMTRDGVVRPAHPNNRRAAPIPPLIPPRAAMPPAPRAAWPRALERRHGRRTP